jgi:hypothetical protein
MLAVWAGTLMASCRSVALQTISALYQRGTSADQDTTEFLSLALMAHCINPSAPAKGHLDTPRTTVVAAILREQERHGCIVVTLVCMSCVMANCSRGPETILIWNNTQAWSNWLTSTATSCSHVWVPRQAGVDRWPRLFTGGRQADALLRRTVGKLDGRRNCATHDGQKRV